MNTDDPLSEIHTLSHTNLTTHLTKLVRISILSESQLQPCNDFFDTLSNTDQNVRIKACLLAWEASRNFDTQIYPCAWQIDATSASINNNNSIINVGTGQGKTQCTVLPQLLFPNSVTIVSSPLKCLMASKVKEYQYWGIRHVMTILGN
jgi:hypothetical protein